MRQVEEKIAKQSSLRLFDPLTDIGMEYVRLEPQEKAANSELYITEYPSITWPIKYFLFYWLFCHHLKLVAYDRRELHFVCTRNDMGGMEKIVWNFLSLKCFLFF